MAVGVQVAGLAVLLAVTAFFSAAEVAFLSISRIRLHKLLSRKAAGAESLARLKAHPQRTIIVVLICSNVATVAASVLAADAAVGAFGDAGLGIATGVMTLLLLTFGEISPKTLASAHAEAFALFSSPFLEVLQGLLRPLVWAFERIIHFVPGSYSRGVVKFTEEEIRTVVTLGAQDQAITAKEKQYIENVLHFNDKKVGQCMTVKERAVAFSPDWSVELALHHALSAAYSRFPVVADGKAVGVVSLKSLARAASANPRHPVSRYMRKPLELQESRTASDAFAHMQAKGANLAVVVSDAGNYVGIVTLEDLLEELVGEIQ